jgi:hypothetical protein
VKIGPENYITGNYDPTVPPDPTIHPAPTIPPQLFKVGTDFFKVKFDGKKLIWTLVTNDSGHKSSVGSVASSTSKKCPKNGLIDPFDALSDTEIRVYPNPVDDYVMVTLPAEPKKGEVALMDVVGREHQTPMMWRGTMGLEINMTGKPAGIYFIRVAAEDGYRRFKILKQ